ncbi:hypothetical protein CDL12_24065 [Handroanthus impetiginosus]|uniref:NAC domain-containing protein n=1 Tax=Handroanthus impetiginosus TaxID=429701 RepID=A0A2G9GDQ1_9LAMI|nr:hypothetical protein CDL12_24065 [Handroanthus impetiginosus]
MENNAIPINVEEESDEEYFNSIAPGFRFRPTDKELIVEYLMPRINNQELPRNLINIVKLYDFSPDDLAASGRYKSTDKNEWYFFTPRNKKYKGGSRPDRSAGDGYWKATETLRNIVHNGELIGYRNTLVYHSGKPRKGIKTDWIMHEFIVKNPPAPVQTTENSMRVFGFLRYSHVGKFIKVFSFKRKIVKLDDWVLCRLHKKAITSNNRNMNGEANNNIEQVVGDDIQNLTPVNSIVAIEQVVGDEIQNLTPVNSIVALEEPVAHNEAMTQNINTYGRLQPLGELPSSISFNLGESFSLNGIPLTSLNDQV